MPTTMVCRLCFFWALGLGGNGILVCGRLCSDGAEGGWGSCGGGIGEGVGFMRSACEEGGCAWQIKWGGDIFVL
jgi:hypothetical protein